MKPLKNNIIIAQEAQKKTTESGIILSAEPKDTPKIGVVLYVGPEVEVVQVGDKVAPNWQAAKPIPVPGGSQCAVLSEDDILAILE